MPSVLKGNNSVITGNTTFTVRPMFGNNIPWDAGNFNPVNYASLSGAVFTGPLTISTVTVTGLLIESTSTPPSNSSSNGITGQHAWDANYEYRCVANNTWKRIALASF